MKDRNKRIRILELIYQIGLVVTVVLFTLAACLVSGVNVVAGYWLLGLSIVAAAGSGAAQVYASVLTSDQIYEDHGMTPPRKQKRHA